MGDQSGSSRFQDLFESALQHYEHQTGISLPDHPLAQQLQTCNSVESIIALLQQQANAFSEFRGSDRILKSLKNLVSVLCKLSATAHPGDAVGLSFPHAKVVHTGLAVLLNVIKDVIGSYDALVELLESIELFLKRLDIYTKIPHTVALTEIVVKIMVELLSTLALATTQIQQGRAKKFVKKFFGEKDVEVVLQRLDRLTQDEARTTAAQTLEVVYGLMQNMRVVMDDGKASADNVRDALELMQKMASDINRSKRDKFQQDLQSWLSPPDPWKNHNIARETSHSGTADWFVHGDTFSEWKRSGPGSLLWIHGKPGAGKSILCSTIVEDVDALRRSGLASLAFFYCDFREDQKKDLRGLLSSVLVQLCDQSDSYCDILSNFYVTHRRGAQNPSEGALVRCFKDILKHPGQAPVYLIIDALDECPNTSALPSPREKVLLLVEGLINPQASNLRICITSRPETDIKIVLDPLTSHTVSLHDERGQMEDIDSYIMSVVNTHPKNRRWKAEDKQLVIDVLMKRADGMFRWVYCQVVYICGCHPGRIRHALAELPETLDETYGRTLREINKADWELAHRLFQCVAVASRPLRVEELAQFLAFDFNAGPIPKFYEDWCLEDPVEAVLSTCSSLLAVVDVEDSAVIQFSHFSVKEFLTSTRLAESRDSISRQYHVSTTPAHYLVGNACLGILLHLDKSITRDSLEKFPLSQYAAEHWVDHARIENVSRDMEHGMKQLFDPSKPHLGIWVWIHDPTSSFRRADERTEIALPPRGTSLHYAAACGFDGIITFLVTEHSMDVHAPGLDDASTALHEASGKGHLEVACVLIKYGASVTAQVEDGRTPLHHASGGRSMEVARVLLEHGADATAQDRNGWTPLHHASIWGSVELVQVLLEHGADATAQDKSGSTPLHLASLGGSAEVVQVLLEHGVDVTAQDKNGSTPLHEASRGGSVDVVQVLLEHGVDLTAQEVSGSTPLHLASFWGSAEVVRVLLEHGVDLTAQDKSGWTPFHQASRGGNAEVVRVFLEHGVDPTAQDRSGSTPLHLASLRGSAEVVQVLLEHGVDLTAQDKGGLTPLHLASFVGRAEAVRVLLEHGVDATAQDKNGSTPLHGASRGGSAEVVQVLLEHGVDVTAQDKRGSTPLHQASLEGSAEVVRVLLEHGADVTALDKSWSTPLHRASRRGCIASVQVLLQYGADMTAQDKSGSTPLHWASRWGHTQVVRFLLELGTETTAQDRNGLTPLHWASTGGCVEVIRVLLEHGVDMTARDKSSSTPLHLASRGGRVEVVRVLLEHGADMTAQDKNGSTSLHLASRGGHVRVARVLLQYGAHPTNPNNMNRAPSQASSAGGYHRTMQLLSNYEAEDCVQRRIALIFWVMTILLVLLTLLAITGYQLACTH